MTHDQQLQALRLFKQIAIRAEQLTGLNLQQVAIVFNLRGQAAGQARVCGKESLIRINPAIFKHSQHYQHDNSDELSRTEALLNEVIAHEMAHICCMKNPRLGHHHNHGWQKLAIELGATGSRTHNLPLSKARQLRQFRYQSTCGLHITVSSIRHRRIQQGQVYRIGQKGTIDSEGFVNEIKV
jgi:predicted SprT family Zn-dependent metalloprotease